MFARLMLLLAAFGLFAMPASACRANQVSAPVAASAMASDCHDQKQPDTGGEQSAECCKSMCAPVLLVTGYAVASRSSDAIVTRERVAVLVTVAPTVGKPPPRNDT